MKVTFPYVFVIGHRDARGVETSRPQVDFISRDVPKLNPSDTRVVARWEVEPNPYRKPDMVCVSFDGKLYLPTLRPMTRSFIQGTDLITVRYERRTDSHALVALYKDVVPDVDERRMARTELLRRYFDFPNLYPGHDKRNPFARPSTGTVVRDTEESDRKHVDYMLSRLVVVNGIVHQEISDLHVVFRNVPDFEGDQVDEVETDWSKDGGKTFVRGSLSGQDGVPKRTSMPDYLRSGAVTEDGRARRFERLEVRDETSLSFDGRSAFIAEHAERMLEVTRPIIGSMTALNAERWLDVRDACREFRSASRASIPGSVIASMAVFESPGLISTDARLSLEMEWNRPSRGRKPSPSVWDW